MWEELQLQIIKPAAWFKFALGAVVTVALYRMGLLVLSWLRPRMSRGFYPVLHALLAFAALLLLAGLTTQAFYLTSSPLFGLGQDALGALRATAGQLLLILALALVAWSVIGELAGRIVPSDEFNRRSVRVRTLKGVVESTLKAVVIFTALIAVLQSIGVNATSLLASASVLGLAVSFGAQSLIKDIFNGFFILLSDQYGVGDDIDLNLGAVSGTVEDINLRTTSVRDISGTLHIMQNGQITAISVKSKDWARVVATVDVAYEADIDQALLVLERVSREMYTDEKWSMHYLDEPDIQGVTALGPDAVTLRGLFKVRPKSQYAVGREFNRRIKIALDESGINIPYPQRRMSFGEGPLDIRLVREVRPAAPTDQDRQSAPVEPSFSKDPE
ncbi:mechanosensitive ion channel family protein [Deinococcus radiophilus]|uniref:Mechanosensitive ion channel family protein n=1 Tax=Deinococcus radiophilus TaxID=32062 RepID=A0A3S0KFD2_9DEIO|nr:mechanosensitive ion channel family protein [Deinococcus radiophilus]RTR25483.1 mechanosensitive ion channel family protein [Deinococcus radiophilus]